MLGILWRNTTDDEFELYFHKIDGTSDELGLIPVISDRGQMEISTIMLQSPSALRGQQFQPTTTSLIWQGDEQYCATGDEEMNFRQFITTARCRDRFGFQIVTWSGWFAQL